MFQRNFNLCDFSIHFVCWGCVWVLENLESPGKIESRNLDLENLENHSRSLKVLENQVILWAFFFFFKIVTLKISQVCHKSGYKFMRKDCQNPSYCLLLELVCVRPCPLGNWALASTTEEFWWAPKALSAMSWGHIFIAFHFLFGYFELSV